RPGGNYFTIRVDKSQSKCHAAKAASPLRENLFLTARGIKLRFQALSGANGHTHLFDITNKGLIRGRPFKMFAALSLFFIIIVSPVFAAVEPAQSKNHLNSPSGRPSFKIEIPSQASEEARDYITHKCKSVSEATAYLRKFYANFAIQFKDGRLSVVILEEGSYEGSYDDQIAEAHWIKLGEIAGLIAHSPWLALNVLQNAPCDKSDEEYISLWRLLMKYPDSVVALLDEDFSRAADLIIYKCISEDNPWEKIFNTAGFIVILNNYSVTHANALIKELGKLPREDLLRYLKVLKEEILNNSKYSNVKRIERTVRRMLKDAGGSSPLGVDDRIIVVEYGDGTARKFKYEKYSKKLFKIIAEANNCRVRIEKDRLDKRGNLVFKSKQIVQFGNHPYSLVSYEIILGKVDKNTIILYEENGEPRKNLRRTVDLKTGLLKGHLPGEVFNNLLKKLDNVRIERDQLNSKGMLSIGGKGLVTFRRYPWHRVDYEIHRGKVDLSSIRVLNKKNMSTKGLRKIVDLNTGKTKGSLLEAISKKYLGDLGDVRIEGDNLNDYGVLEIAGITIRFSNYPDHPVSYEIVKGGVVSVDILNDKGGVIHQEILKVCRDCRGKVTDFYRGHWNLLPKRVWDNIENISEIDGHSVEKGNYLILGRGERNLVYNFTRWGDFERRPVRILFKDRKRLGNLPDKFIFATFEGKDEFIVLASEAFCEPAAMLFSQSAWQFGGEDEKEMVRVSPYDTEEEVLKRELRMLVRQAIAALPQREQKLAEDILDALNYMREENVQEYSLWKEISKKLAVGETEVIKIFSFLAEIMKQKKQAYLPGSSPLSSFSSLPG
ncbi:MAG TPA: hypothetical protein DCL49_11600, partial [Candidatus Omnitrophica bacterium]|nr:hypothetical protein [Candidatus Omnitrophota bacterium]